MSNDSQRNMSGKRRVFRINNMTGLVNTMAEDNAYLTIDPNANLGVGFSQVPFEFKRIENFKPTNRGGLSKTAGYRVDLDTASGRLITGIYRYIKADHSEYVLLAYGGDVYQRTGTSSHNAIGMSVELDAPLHFETAYDRCIVSDGVNAVQTFNGNVVANLSSGADATAISGGRQVIFHQNRLFVFSATHDQSLVYYSAPGDIASGYASQFVQCDVNDGQRITSIARFFIPGELQPILIVGKERSIGMIIGDGTSTNPYTFVKVADDTGVPGFRQIVQFEQDAAFLTNRGVSSYRSSLEGTQIERRLLSKNITNQFTSLPQNNLKNALAWLDWKNRRVSFALPTVNAQYADVIWHYDIELKGFYTQRGFELTAAFVDTDGSVLMGTPDGKILRHDNTVYAYGNQRINGVIETPYLDFFEPHYYKRIVNGRVIARGNGSYNLGIGAKINNGTGQGTSHTIHLSAGAYAWGDDDWHDEESATYQWGASPLVRAKFFPGQIFENISFTLTQSGANQPVDFLEMILEVEYLNLL